MTTKKPTQKERGSNTVLDRIWQGLAAGAILALAFREILRHVEATYPMNFALALGALLFLVYAMVAPIFRR